MRLLDRYLLRELLIPLGYCLTGFMIFWISFDLFSELGEFEERQMGFAAIGRYYLVKAPELMVVVMPIALLLSLLYALTNHARANELVAIRAAGVSIWRLSIPYFGVGLSFGAALFALNELWAPQSAEAAAAMMNRKPSASSSDAGAGRWQPVHFNNLRDGRSWTIAAFNLDTYEMKDPQVGWVMPDQGRRSLIADRAVRTNGIWVFYNVQEIAYPAPKLSIDGAVTNQFDVNSREYPELPVPEFSETPEQIKSEIKISRITQASAAKEVQLSIAEISDYLRLHPDLSESAYALLHTQLHARLAWPWTCLVVVVIALPFGAASGRRNVFVGVASSIFICFAFFIVLKFGLMLGSGRWLTPWIAAWLPNLLFAAAGVGLTWRVR